MPSARRRREQDAVNQEIRYRYGTVTVAGRAVLGLGLARDAGGRRLAWSLPGTLLDFVQTTAEDLLPIKE
jgi:hypothetical protein